MAAAAAAGAGAAMAVPAAFQPLPPPHDLSECPRFDHKLAARASRVLSLVVAPDLARRIARAVATNATTDERGDTAVLTAVIAKARAGTGAWPWTTTATRLIAEADNTRAPALGLWYRVLQCDGDRGTPLRWDAEADRPVLECVTWACLKQGLRLNYRADGDDDTPLTAAVYHHSGFAHALLSLPPRVGLDVHIPDRVDQAPFVCAVEYRSPRERALVMALGRRCSDALLNAHVPSRPMSPLWSALEGVAKEPGEGAGTLRALLALARVDGSGVSVVDLPPPRTNRSFGSERSATVRDAYEAVMRAYGLDCSAADREADVEEALAEADALCAAVRAYPPALLQALRDALDPTPLAPLHGVLQLVTSYVVVPPLPMPAPK